MFTAPAKDFRETNFTLLPASYGERPLGFRRTWRKGKGVFAANEFHYFLAQARGSLVEVGTQLMMAQNPTYFSPEHGKDRMDKAAELGKILNRLIGAIRPAA
jgi:hypothetical protein